jgi:hypothetical protein
MHILDIDALCEVGGKGKDFTQLGNHERGYLILDDILYPSNRIIPLWCLGLLY